MRIALGEYEPRVVVLLEPRQDLPERLSVDLIARREMIIEELRPKLFQLGNAR